MPSYKEFRAQTKRRKAKRIALRVFLLCIIVALLLAASYIGVRIWTDKNTSALPPSIEEPLAPPALVPELKPDVALGLQRWDSLLPVEQTINLGAALAADSHLLALPNNGKVTKDFFRGAMFIGDSLTQGFGIYPDAFLNWSAVCAYRGVGPKALVTNAVSRNVRDERVAPLDEIFSFPVDNIHSVYILFGTNVLENQSDEAILKYYQDLLNILKPHFLPGTDFYIQGIPPATDITAHKRPAFSLEHIYQLNNAIAMMAHNNGMHYIDTHEALAADNGYLREDLAGSDGIHMKASPQYIPWVDYLSAHTVYNPRTLQFYAVPPQAV